MSIKSKQLAAVFAASMLATPMGAQSAQAMTIVPNVQGDVIITYSVNDPEKSLFARTSNGIMLVYNDASIPFPDMQQCLAEPENRLPSIIEELDWMEDVYSSNSAQDYEGTLGVKVEIICLDNTKAGDVSEYNSITYNFPTP